MSAAGKTGTTSEWRDSWFVGYTPCYTCGIWAGYDNNEVMPDEDRYHTFSRILWNSVMKRISAMDTPMRFQLTSEVMSAPVCSESHMAASVRCPNSYDEMFAKGTQPQYYCSIHGDGSLVSGGSGGIGDVTGPAAQEQIVILNQDSNTGQAMEEAPEDGSDANPVWDGYGDRSDASPVWDGSDASPVWSGSDASPAWEGSDADSVWNGSDADPAWNGGNSTEMTVWNSDSNTNPDYSQDSLQQSGQDNIEIIS